jgi:hypothetical protein
MPHLERVIHLAKHYDELVAMFSEADQTIAALEQAGRRGEATMSRADYDRAEAAWVEYECDQRYTNLRKILARVPEMALVAILIFLAMTLWPRLG